MVPTELYTVTAYEVVYYSSVAPDHYTQLTDGLEFTLSTTEASFDCSSYMCVSVCVAGSSTDPKVHVYVVFVLIKI